ncbi:MAG: TetR/AcrR family transcriptional regulator [Desulfobacter sp.]
MKKIERKKEQKRTAILTAARETFRTDGYIGAGMDKIAKSAGVTKQTVYRYFPSKEVLFRAALEAQRRETRNPFLDELDRKDTTEALLHFALGFLKTHMSEDHLAGIRLLVSEGPDAPEMTRSYFAVGPEKTEARLAGFLRERFGTRDPEYAVKVLINTLLSMRMGVLVGLTAPPSPEEMHDHAEKTVRIFMRTMS